MSQGHIRTSETFKNLDKDLHTSSSVMKMNLLISEYTELSICMLSQTRCIEK